MTDPPQVHQAADAMENMCKPELLAILENWAKPDPSLVGTLPRGGTKLEYLGHAEVTRALIQVDPFWSWEPFALAESGAPLIEVGEKVTTMWIRLTVLGVTRIGCGSCDNNKPEVSKELIGDALRNAGMRFGIALSLWSKQEWHEVEAQPIPTWQMRIVKNGVVAEIEKQLKVPKEAAVALGGMAWDQMYDGDRIEWPVEEARAFIFCVCRFGRVD